jgi:CAI-1 autoinducer synthase
MEIRIMSQTNNHLETMSLRPIHAPIDPTFLHHRVQRYYTERLEKTWGYNHPMKGRTPGPDSIKMRSNDYLCLAGHPQVVAAEIAELRRSGHGDSVSRIWLHHEHDSLNGFERRIANLMQAEAAVLCNSGYCANVGLVQAVAEPQTPVYLDMKAHLSLWEGVKSAGAIAVPFRHNDPEHLARIASKYGPGLVVVDAVYSIDGNVCALKDIIEVAERFGSAMIVDETHSFGTHGPDGAGLVVAEGLTDRVHFRTIGLSKAVASRGGIVICSARNAEFLRYESLPTIFSTSVLAHEVAGYDAVLNLFASEPWRQRRLHQSHTRLRKELDALGYNVDLSKSQIIALEAGEIRQTVKLRDALEKRGVFGALFFPPATPEKRCLIRFTVNCGLTDQEIDRVIDVCKDIRDEVDLAIWPSTRRKSRPVDARLEKQLAA